MIFATMAFGQTQPESKPQLLARGSNVLGTLTVIAQEDQEKSETEIGKANSSIKRMSGEGFEFRYNSYIVTAYQAGSRFFKARFFSIPTLRMINIGFSNIQEPLIISLLNQGGELLHKQTTMGEQHVFEQSVNDIDTDARFYLQVHSEQGRLFNIYTFEKIE